MAVIINNCNNNYYYNDEGLNYTVGSQFINLEKLFLNLKKRLSVEMRAKAITTDMLLDSLTNLPLELQAEYRDYVEEKLEEFMELETVSKIIFKLNLHLNCFIDYSLLEHLIKEFGSDPLKEDMLAYVEKLQCFLEETNVLQLKDHLRYSPDQEKLPLNFSVLEMKFEEDPSTFSLRKLDDLRRDFCQNTRLSKMVVTLIGVRKVNSFIVMWKVPSVVTPKLIESIHAMDKSLFKRENVSYVSLNDQELYSSIPVST